MKQLFPVLFLLPLFATAQSTRATDDFNFALYLLGSGLKEEAATLMCHRDMDSDSMRFIKGYVLYSNRQLDSATYWLQQIDSHSPLFAEGRLFGAISATHLGEYRLANNLLQSLRDNPDPSVRNLVTFEEAGIALLERDLSRFDSCSALIQADDYRIADETEALRNIRTTLPLRQKSPMLAAGLSTVVPGLGKVYAGRVGEGVSAFLIVGSLMAATAENAYKEGWANWKTILFGSLSAVFHLGNIYGSAVSVRVDMDNRNKQTDVQILYHIHIPLRNSYRR